MNSVSNDFFKKIESITKREGNVCVCIDLLFGGLHKLAFSLLIDRREK